MIADLGLRPESEETLKKYPHPAEAGKPSALFHKTDVVDWSQLSAVFEATLKAFGRVDIVVNGAGIFEAPWTSFWNPPGVSPLAKDAADAQIGSYNIFNINAIAPIRLSQIAIDYWLQNRDIQGSFMSLSSMGAYIHSIQTPFYFASKSALVSVHKSLQALKKLVGIRNAVICPGPTRTPLFDQDFCKDRLAPEDLALTAGDVADLMMRALTEEQYGDGNILEIMKTGTAENPEIVEKQVQLEALYPALSPMGMGKAMEEEIKFMGLVAQKGMRTSLP
ncbi:NAD(P)-binding protein [Thozetella sp. PMI_491]|nr:NAD(P)-binding protein [Thozetella sp. PMI_491]